jgi:hypothetical protein
MQHQMKKKSSQKKQARGEVKICRSCGKPYRVDPVLGDLNLGVCNKAVCVLRRMREEV